MEQGITLTPHQQQAVDWIVDKLLSGTPLIALRGYAGCGKTVCVPVLQRLLEAQGLSVAVGAPTHRATMILRKKGIVGAETVHSLALTPYFNADYARAAAWLGEDVPCRWADDDPPHDDVGGLPWLVHEAVQPNLEKARALLRWGDRYPAKRRLASIGISGKNYFAGFGPKQGDGVLIIDEASMVGSAMLALCREAFPQVCLIGDPGQLPPVKDEALLASVLGVDLTEVHRQAQDSPIIQLAYRARNGEAFWTQRLTRLGDIAQDDVVEIASALAPQFLESPLIVWRNVTRVSCTHAIREALGFAYGTLYAGEPLVCRSTQQEDRAEGFYNNGLYTITAVDPHDPRRVTVTDALGRESIIWAHLEELDGEGIDPKAIPFRFGYCLTAHTAQGGEWPTVYISLPDLKGYAAFAAKNDRASEIAQWTYTAITRAKHTLCFLTQHDFTPASAAGQEQLTIPETARPFSAQEQLFMAEPMKPPSAPMMHQTPDEQDDILDPPVPPEVTQTAATPAGPPTPEFNAHEALLHGFCQSLQRRLDGMVIDHTKSVMRSLEAVFEGFQKQAATFATVNEHATYQLSNALEAVSKSGQSSPYQVTIAAKNPDGFPVELSIAKQDAGELIQALGAVFPWLKDAGYTPAA